MNHIMKIAAATFLIGVAGLLVYESQADTPRMECLKRCQDANNACLASAGDDESKRSACDQQLDDCLKPVRPQNKITIPNRHQHQSKAALECRIGTPTRLSKPTRPSPGAACSCLGSVVIDSRSDWLQFKRVPFDHGKLVPDLKPLTI